MDLDDDFELDLCGCKNLQKLPKITGNIRRIGLRGTLIEELPSSVGSLSSLEYLDMWNCRSLVLLPNSICELGQLKVLHLEGCSKLEKLPPNLEGLCFVFHYF